MKLTRVFIPLLLVAASACTTVRVGRDFDLAAFDAKVVRGVTTQADVRGWLGEPVGIGGSVDTSGERYQEWNYYYGAVRVPGGAESPVKVLQIKFDQRGVVRSYNWSGQRG
jgi:outer membrane protein assembly factor BamE (lipoprotein component of BamABCDE complex)